MSHPQVLLEDLGECFIPEYVNINLYTYIHTYKNNIAVYILYIHATTVYDGIFIFTKYVDMYLPKIQM